MSNRIISANNSELIERKEGKQLCKYTATDLICAERMYDRICMIMPYTAKPNFHKWADVLRKMRTVDGLPLSEIGAVFRWANQDSFWQTNILSPTKLRKQFARLHACMLKDMMKSKQARSSRDVTFEERLTDTSWAFD